MKRLILLFGILTGVLNFSQSSKDTIKFYEKEVYQPISEKAVFNGGDESFKKKIIKNFRKRT